VRTKNDNYVPDTRPDALWRSGDYFALAMNYSAVANHSVNQTVHVESHAPACLSMKQKYKNCMSAATPECSAF
jgi:hypothetical protein